MFLYMELFPFILISVQLKPITENPEYSWQLVAHCDYWSLTSHYVMWNCLGENFLSNSLKKNFSDDRLNSAYKQSLYINIGGTRTYFCVFTQCLPLPS